MESEPWTMFSCIEKPKSPRIDPGKAFIGSVAPISWYACTAFRPFTTIITTGSEVIYLIKSLKNSWFLWIE